MSVCSGRSQTEVHSDDLCLCLDKDKQSLFATAFALKYLCRRKNNIVYCHQKMENGLLNILTSLQHICCVPLVVLFQHPSPVSRDKSGNYLAEASRQCIMALGDGIIDSIHYIYDVHESSSKTSWKGKCLLVVSTCTEHQCNKIFISKPIVISKQESKTVHHPVFGITKRYGWANAKVGKEMSFFITSKK